MEKDGADGQDIGATETAAVAVEDETTKISASSGSGLLQAMHLNRDLSNLCDALFVVKGEEFGAHRAVLANSSPVFAAMFTNGMKESQRLEWPQRIKLPHMQVSAIRNLLQFIYTRNACVSCSDALHLLRALHFYQMEDLQIAVESSLCERVSLQTYFELWHHASCFSLGRLRKTALLCVSSELDKVRCYDELKQWPLELLVETLELTRAKKSHILLIAGVRAVLSWISADQTRRVCHSDSILLSFLESFSKDTPNYAWKEIGVALIQLAPYTVVAKDKAKETMNFFYEELVDLEMKNINLKGENEEISAEAKTMKENVRRLKEESVKLKYDNVKAQTEMLRQKKELRRYTQSPSLYGRR